MDVRACIDAPIVVAPDDTDLVPTGITIHFGDPELAAVILPRSAFTSTASCSATSSA
jgi:dUTP pyrophosphatase